VGTAAKATVAELTLGWFLADWNAGDLDRAREIYERMHKESPVAGAMLFLLDEVYTVEQPPKALEKDRALLYFVAGERYKKTGRHREALEGFERSLEFSEVQRGENAGIDSEDGEHPRSWLESEAEARIVQMREQLSTQHE
jgi:tetratricopeptide (TPR) repeat protein